ncbi:hypothetical protein CFO_g1330 [Ceratocystis platani]|uniref:Aminoglycoside phosphotransferase domain-containing protein n=1 Tax=Ceratocystis fimbriata f. sp. platani TaxID=88771 RepID=A0A0F8B6F9_CERFI|nr:hypothetical protein CFO_g1330 [Ceratocystis platani]
MLRKLAKIQSPTGQFGPVTSILNGPHCQSRLCFSHAQDWTANTWELTFHRLLEGALRDSEDLYVTLPFSRIRANAERFLPMLRHVTCPSLVCVDAGIDGNTLALREEDIVRLSQSEQARMASIIKDAKSRMTSHTERSRTKRPIPMYTSAEQQPSRSDVAMYDSTMAVTGLVDWSMCFFGDPLFAEVLSHCPSVDLLQGFNETPSSSGFSLNQDTTAWDDTTSPRRLTPWSSLVEDRRNAHVRILLYECYHAISRITAQFVRPKTANTATELAARRRLMQAITKLDGMDDDGLPLTICGPPMNQTKTKMSPNHPRPSGEMSPAKRPRSVSSDDDDAEEGAYTRPYGFKKSPPR